ncbi:MAG: zinc ribbon domain-containing protein [Terriglobales bacterium]
MEHPCYKCGAGVEDGTPFCPRCNAPQIRVAGSTSLAPVATPDGTLETSAPYTLALQSGVEWHRALPSAGIALVAGIFIIVISKSTGLGMLTAGFLSVVLYRRRCPLTHFTTGMGARLGALTGGLGFGILAAILALWAAFRSGKQIHDAFLIYLQQSAAHSSDPRVQQVLDLFNTPDGFTFIMILALLMTLVGFVIFSSAGGALAAFLLYRKERP